jgi:hypothetical protein
MLDFVDQQPIGARVLLCHAPFYICGSSGMSVGGRISLPAEAGIPRAGGEYVVMPAEAGIQ